MLVVCYFVEEFDFDVNEVDFKGYMLMYNVVVCGDNVMIFYFVFYGVCVDFVVCFGEMIVDMVNGFVQCIQFFLEMLVLFEGMGLKNNDNCVFCQCFE